ncbi:TIGR02452 family protein [Streptomyces xanthophaeus]
MPSFAPARNSGGGHACGATAQEEAPCRASALHETLLEAPEYDAVHRAGRSTFYTDRVIRSPGVPVFRDDRGERLEEPFRAPLTGLFERVFERVRPGPAMRPGPPGRAAPPGPGPPEPVARSGPRGRSGYCQP